MLYREQYEVAQFCPVNFICSSYSNHGRHNNACRICHRANHPGTKSLIREITPVAFCNLLNLICITIPIWK